MNDLLASITPPPSIAKYLYWATGYSISICTLYLWGYWSTFDINILQYADISTILKLAALPLLIGFVGLMLGSVLGHFIFGIEPSEEERLVAQNSHFGRWLRNNTRVFSGAWVFLTALYALLGPANKWQILPVLIALPVSSVLTVRGFASDLFPDRSIRTALIFLFVTAIPYAYANGLRAAEAIETGARFSYVLSPIEGLDVKPDSVPEIRPRFLGQVTDLLFFYSPVEKSVSVVKFNDEKALTLKRYVKPSQSVSDWLSDLWKKVSDQGSSDVKPTQDKL
jgi:hypothetical protein